MKEFVLVVNGKEHKVEAVPTTPLLWILRDNLGLNGAKYGCGVGACGSCTIHLDGQAFRSCLLPVADAVGKKITTIEGLSPDGSHPVQRAWIAEDVAQCGYCQTGQIMSAAALLAATPRPSNEQIDEAMRHNVCRCGTYQRIRTAIHRAAKEEQP